jgi:hypothetical protein
MAGRSDSGTWTAAGTAGCALFCVDAAPGTAGCEDVVVGAGTSGAWAFVAWGIIKKRSTVAPSQRKVAERPWGLGKDML